jgi:hypothetical protein
MYVCHISTPETDIFSSLGSIGDPSTVSRAEWGAEGSRKRSGNNRAYRYQRKCMWARRDFRPLCGNHGNISLFVCLSIYLSVCLSAYLSCAQLFLSFTSLLNTNTHSTGTGAVSDSNGGGNRASIITRHTTSFQPVFHMAGSSVEAVFGLLCMIY